VVLLALHLIKYEDDLLEIQQSAIYVSTSAHVKFSNNSFQINSSNIMKHWTLQPLFF